MKVVVIGVGPSGLLAAWALREEHEVHLIGPDFPSKIAGAQYIHSPVEGLTGEPEMVTYAKVGTRAGYAKKIYGSEDAPVSWDLFNSGEYPAWPMEPIYAQLWEWACEESSSWLRDVVTSVAIPSLCDKFDLVINTAPAPEFCFRPEHQFRKAGVYVGEIPIIGVRNMIVYNGREEDRWYRASNLFGHISVECGVSMFESREYDDLPRATDYVTASEGKVRRSYPVRLGRKPISTNCDCHLNRENYVRLGRFGMWHKSQLVHKVYEQAKEFRSRVV